MSRRRRVHLLYPHQLFESLLELDRSVRFIVVEDDLLYRQYPFHVQKLILHRSSVHAFAQRLRDAGFDVDVIESRAERTSRAALAELVERLAPDELRVIDPVDDWLERDCRAALAVAGHPLTDDLVESPNFLTTRAQIRQQLGGKRRPRMQHFYAWQRRRLDVLVDDGQPVGGRWSFDTENRRKLPRWYPVPSRARPQRTEHVGAAMEWAAEHFPDAPGNADGFWWPTTHDQARAAMTEFFTERFTDFGPFEDAIATGHPFLFHSTLSPAINLGLLQPGEVLAAALAAAERDRTPLPSLEGYVRQLIGWREYMRATYVQYGRRMRMGNALGHVRPLAAGWWRAETGLEPVDRALAGVLERGWAHHIERLMVFGSAMCLLRTHPDAVYQWFLEMFVDAYDWVMVPNTYAMSQFAAGSLITTKPYVSGSNYLRKMSDLPAGEWTHDWDALYWTFVRDHADVLGSNPRARTIPDQWATMDPARKRALEERARPWLGDA